MCFGGGSQPEAPISTPSYSTDDAYKHVKVEETKAPTVEEDEDAQGLNPGASLPSADGLNTNNLRM